MSFLLSALGSMGSSLLPSLGGFLMNKVGKPLLGRIGGYFSSMFGGDKNQGLGRTVMDKAYQTGVNATYNGI